MTDFDLDRLGDMWRQEPDPAEMKALRRAADEIARKARRSQIVEGATAIAVSLGVVLLTLSNPRIETVLLGAAAIAIMLYSSLRQRQFRQAELRSLTGTAEEMLAQSVMRARATLKRTRLGMLLAPPAFIAGIGFAAAVDGGSGSRLIGRLAVGNGPPFLIASLLLFAVSAALFHYYRQTRRTRRELDQLIALQDAFHRERDNSGA